MQMSRSEGKGGAQSAFMTAGSSFREFDQVTLSRNRWEWEAGRSISGDGGDRSGFRLNQPNGRSI